MIYNIHIHTFDGILDTPDRLFGVIPMFLLKKNESWQWISGFLHTLNPFSDKDKWDRLKNFGDKGKMDSQEARFLDCYSNYPEDTVFCILSMDMSLMGAGKVRRSYEKQLIELSNLKKKYPNNIKLFTHIDCRRLGYFELFKKTIEQWGFDGLKLYPPYGVFPYDSRYDDIYSYCEINKIPIIAHCTQNSTMHFEGNKKYLKELLKKECKLEIDWAGNNKLLCDYFTNPINYRKVFAKFPKLKISLAHIGRGNEWDKLILGMMKEFTNLYSDCSYTMYNEEEWFNLKLNLITNEIFRQRCLFGSDYYMNTVECDEKKFSKKFRVFLGEELWKQITETNAEKFLNIK
jgi:predicted TIM-barrel fold metal-dependent hydrolase